MPDPSDYFADEFGNPRKGDTPSAYFGRSFGNGLTGDPNIDPNNLEAGIASALENQPMLQSVLGAAGTPISAITNALQGEFGKAGENLLDLGRAVSPFHEQTYKDRSSFKDVLTNTLGIKGNMGEFDVPLIGRVTGKGALGLAGDIALDPLRFVRPFGSTTKGLKLAKTGEGVNTLAKGEVGRAAALAGGLPVSKAGRQVAAGERAAFGVRVPFSENVVPLIRGQRLVEWLGRGQDWAAKTAIGRAFSNRTGLPEFSQIREAGLSNAGKVTAPMREAVESLVPKLVSMAKKAGVPVEDFLQDVARIGEQKASIAKIIGDTGLDLKEVLPVYKQIKGISQKIANDLHIEGFTPKEIIDVTNKFIMGQIDDLSETSISKALGAAAKNRIYDDIGNADRAMGLPTPHLNDRSLNYRYRDITPEAQAYMEELDLHNHVFSKLDQRLSAKGRPQKQRVDFNRGKLVDEINAEWRATQKVDFDLLNADPTKNILNRIVKTERAANLAGIVEKSARMWGRTLDDAAVAERYVPIKDLINQLHLDGIKKGTPGLSKLSQSLLGMKKMGIPVELAQELRRFAEVLTDVTTPNRLLKVLDGATNAFKGGVTSIFPEFHARNMISNVYANFLADVNMTAYGESAKIMRDWKKIQHTGEGGQTWNLGKRKVTTREFIDEMKAHRVYGFGQYSASELGSAEGGVFAGKYNPLGIGRKFGSDVETFAKIAHVVDKLKKGFNTESAVASAKKYLFDYGDLSPFEKTVMRRVVPFYTFARKNIPLQLESLLMKPGKASMVGHLQRALQAGTEDEGPLNINVVPPWIRERLFGAKRNDDGSIEVMSGFGIGLEDLSRLDQPFLGFIRDINPLAKATVQAVTGKDLFRGKNLSDSDKAPGWMSWFDGVPGGNAVLEWLDYKPVTNNAGEVIFHRANPKIMNWISALTAPASRASSTLDAITRAEQEDTMGAQALKVGTGMRQLHLDPTQQMRNNLQNLVTMRIEHLRQLKLEGVTGELQDKFYLRKNILGNSERENEVRDINRELAQLLKAIKELRK